MKIYLDMCSIHRPLDDKTQVRVALEAEGVVLGASPRGAVHLLNAAKAHARHKERHRLLWAAPGRAACEKTSSTMGRKSR